MIHDKMQKNIHELKKELLREHVPELQDLENFSRGILQNVGKFFFFFPENIEKLFS